MIKELYLKNGIVQIPKFFCKDEIDVLRLSALKAYASGSSNIQYQKGFPSLMFHPKGLDYYRDAILPVVREYLETDKISQLNNQYYFKMPGDQDQFAWHQDITFRTPKEKFKQIETGYLQTAIIVDEMGPHNGGIEFVLGSHKNSDLGLIPRDNSEKGLREYSDQYKGTCFNFMPGDLVLWSVMIIHGSQPNNSNHYRAYYMNGFAKTECLDASLKFPEV